MFRVLLAADGNTPRVRRQAEAIANLPDVTESVEVYLLHVFDDSTVDDDSDVVNPRRIKAVTEAEEYLQERGIDVEVLGRAGKTLQAILAVTDEYDIDQIFVGGPKRSPTGKAVFGSLTQDVILQSDVPVTVTIDRK